METPVTQPSIVKNSLLGFQHLLAMYSGDILVPLLVGSALHFTATQMTLLVSLDIFMCGLATLLQLKRTALTGIALPVVLGSAVEYVAPLEHIGNTLGYGYMYGGIIIAGVFIILFSGLVARLQRFFPPVVTGSLITLIGFTLIPVAFQNIGGGDATAKNYGQLSALLLAGITIVVILVIQQLAHGFLKHIAILLGILVGTLSAIALGQVSFQAVGSAHWLQLPQPFLFATPKFEWSSALTLILAAITCMIESTGVYYALSDITHQPLDQAALKRGYRSEGIAAVLGGIFNTFPYSTFSQNVGIVQLSGVKTLRPVYYSAFLLIFLGLIPKFGAIATLIPSSVLGGAMLVMFGMVGAQGIKMLSQVEFSTENLLIIALSIGMGLGATPHPTLFQFLPATLQTILSNGMVIGCLTAIILNALFNNTPRH